MKILITGNNMETCEKIYGQVIEKTDCDISVVSPDFLPDWGKEALADDPDSMCYLVIVETEQTPVLRPDDTPEDTDPIQSAYDAMEEFLNDCTQSDKNLVENGIIPEQTAGIQQFYMIADNPDDIAKVAANIADLAEIYRGLSGMVKDLLIKHALEPGENGTVHALYPDGTEKDLSVDQYVSDILSHRDGCASTLQLYARYCYGKMEK